MRKWKLDESLSMILYAREFWSIFLFDTEYIQVSTCDNSIEILAMVITVSL
jgi:hypothetical protein